MGDEMEYNDSLARSGASQFEQVALALSTLSASLSSELGSDSPWSNDKIGSSFGTQFDPHRTTAIDNVENFATKVASYAPAITRAADGVVTTDQS